MPSSGPGAAPERPVERWVLAAAILATSMAFIDSTAVNVALPALQRDLSASGVEVLWIVNAYVLFLASLLLVGGSLGDRFGRKRVFTAGIAVFASGSLLCGLAPTARFLIAARALQGLGGALMVPGSLSLLSALTAESRRGQAIGTWSAVSTAATILGPVLGGYLAEAGLWRGVFFINVPLAGVAIAGLGLRVPESIARDMGGPIDLLGAASITAGLGSLTFGAIEASSRGLSSPLVLGSLVLSGIAFLVFITVETRAPEPMVPFRLFQSRLFSGANLFTLCLYGALSAGLFFMTLNMIQIQGYSESQAGYTLVPFTILIAVLSRWAGRLVDQFGPRRPLILGPAIAGLGFALLAAPGVTAGPSSFWSTFFPGIFALGIGMGVTIAPLTATVMGAHPSGRTGAASGINNAIARLAGLLAVAILGGISLATFRAEVLSRASTLGLSPEVTQQLVQEAENYGNAQVPDDAGHSAAAVRSAINQSFVRTYRIVSLSSAGLALASTLIAALTIRGRLPRSGEQTALDLT